MTLEGNPWFVAADVLRCLGMPTEKGVRKYLGSLDRDEMQMSSPGNIGGKGRGITTLIAESGLFKFLLKAETQGKPHIKAFQDWVTKEVLPSIRKTGTYSHNQQAAQPSTQRLQRPPYRVP